MSKFIHLSHEKSGVGHIKGRFRLFRMYHNFAYLFYKLSESSFYKEMSKFSKEYRVKSIRSAVMLGIP